MILKNTIKLLVEYLKKYRWLLIIWVIFVLFTLFLTFLYDRLPLIIHKGLFGQESFYSGFITNMYNTCLDFLVLTIVVAVITKIKEKKDSMQRYHEEIENCRHWEEAEATYKIRARLLELNRMGDKEINLSQCYLRKVILKRLDLVKSNFKGTNLSYANIEEGIFNECTFLGTMLNNTIARKDEFKKCTIKNVKFEDSNIKSTKFYDCIIISTNFSNSDLSNAGFYNCDLQYCSFENCNLERTVFKNCKNLNIDSLNKAKKLSYTYVDKDYYGILEITGKTKDNRFRTSQNQQ